MLEQEVVVAPGRGRDVDGVRSHDPLQKLGSIPQSSGSAQTLKKEIVT